MFPTKILLATDGSEGSARAARAAVELSERLDSPLHVVYVEPLSDYYPLMAPTLYYPAHLLPEMRERAHREAEKRLDGAALKVSSLGEASGAHARVGQPDAEILRVAEEVGAGLVVVGSRGLGSLKRALMGSVSSSVVYHARDPVLVVRGDGDDLPGRVLAATDGSEESNLAAGIAAELATKTGSELHLVTVGVGLPLYELPDAAAGFEEAWEDQKRALRSLLDAQVAAIEASGTSVTEAHVRTGKPDAEIVRLAEELEAVVVVGSRGLRGVRRALMGSVSDSVVRHARGSVLVVRSAFAGDEAENARATLRANVGQARG